MMTGVSPDVPLSKSEYKSQMATLTLRLGELQRECYSRGIPVIVVLSGPSASGKGLLVGKLVMSLDPRGFRLHTQSSSTNDAQLHPFFWDFWRRLPPKGALGIFMDNWYRPLFHRAKRFKSATAQTDWFRRINAFERQLADSDYAFAKFYLHVSKREQKKRLKKLAADPNTSWRVTKRDLIMLKRFDRYSKNAALVLESTHTEVVPWTILPADNWRFASLTMTRTLVETMEKAVSGGTSPRAARPALTKRASKQGALRLADFDLSKSLDRDRYEKDLDRLQGKLRRLQNVAYRKRIPIALAYEGWDAAGKGGNIRRLVSGLDPRGYRVIPIAAPTGEEKSHHYLWRFWKNAPRNGHIFIFDRTWYGRVLVEKIEGFCTPVECERAYTEIVEMEQEWAKSGALIMKFWLHLSKDEQLRRFKLREKTPHKLWKITDEDWRNREKWDDYAQAVDLMLKRTNSKYAPWIVVESNCKLHARTKVLKAVVEQLEARL